MSTVEAKNIEGHIKWWNPTKRYGFITFEDGDALLPLAMIKAAGYETLATGTHCKAYVEKTEKGWVVRKLEEVGPPDIEKLGGIAATVKWYSSTIGYGFVIPHNAAEEIFLHASVLRAAELSDLSPGQAITVVISETERGKRVSLIALREAEAAPAA